MITAWDPNAGGVICMSTTFHPSFSFSAILSFSSGSLFSGVPPKPRIKTIDSISNPSDLTPVFYAKIPTGIDVASTLPATSRVVTGYQRDCGIVLKYYFGTRQSIGGRGGSANGSVALEEKVFTVVSMDK